jgi:ectoine hydroxylase-related dioxygenase (phytanoyl-CoA dioxygenase family)
MDALAPEDVTFYREQGYWISPRIFNDAELEKIRRHLAQVVAGEYETGRSPLLHTPEPGDLSEVVQVLNAHWTDATIARAALDERLGAMAAQLAGVAGIRLFHDQLIYKPPDISDASHIGWHQDLGYWTCIDDARTLTAWIALDEITELNGCMEVVPQSHTWGILGENDFRGRDLDEQIKRIEARSGRPFATAHCTMGAGCVSFHNGGTIHGSRANRSDRPRRSLVVHMIPDGTCFRGGTPADDNWYNKWIQAKDGDPYVGPYFPVIYREGNALGNVWAVGERSKVAPHLPSSTKSSARSWGT